uniref:uncharacterized protein LOC120328177 n=1 Tax=Styela clava TaxID=7725 RepID=UPI0019399C5D|nr:uncharacterized protein LOC120328177 [Styela clava]
MKEASRGVKIAFTVIGVLVFLLSFIFAFLNNVPVGFEQGNSTVNAAGDIFINTIADLDVRYPVTVVPPAYVLVVIWPLIYFWNLIGAAYLVASLFLSNEKSPVLREPALFPIGSLVFWSLSFGFPLAWLFAFDREILWLSLFLIMAGAWSIYATLGFSYASYYKDILVLEEHNSTMLWLVRIIFHNGLGIFATWLTIGWKLTLQTTIAYKDGAGDQYPADFRGSLTPEDAGTISFSILLFEIMLWFVLENFVFEPYCRYTVTIYPTLIFALSSTFSNDYVVPYSRNLIITLVGLILSILAFIARVVLVYFRHKNRPQMENFRSKREEVVEMENI